MNPTDILNEARTLVEVGGWVFVGLLALAFGIAFALLSLWSATRLPDAPFLPPREWVALLRSRPGHEEARGKLGNVLSRFPDQAAALEEIGRQLFAKTRRRLPFAFTLISAAPLVGLLGTVSGMFTTFAGMADTKLRNPIDVISDGISEALITTQTGLIIGIPTFILCSWLRHRHEELETRFRQLGAEVLTPDPS